MSTAVLIVLRISLQNRFCGPRSADPVLFHCAGVRAKNTASASVVG